MKYELYKDVALATDIPEHRLQKGDIAKVVEYLPGVIPDSEPGYALEVFNTLGETIDVFVVGESEIESLGGEDEVWHVRQIAEHA
jgi:hypothetical protein